MCFGGSFLKSVMWADLGSNVMGIWLSEVKGYRWYLLSEGQVLGQRHLPTYLGGRSIKMFVSITIAWLMEAVYEN